MELPCPFCGARLSQMRYDKRGVPIDYHTPACKEMRRLYVVDQRTADRPDFPTARLLLERIARKKTPKKRST